MGMRIEFFADTAEQVVNELWAVVRAMSERSTTPAPVVPLQAPITDPIKAVKGKKGALVVEQPTEAVTGQPQMFPEVKTVEQLQADERPSSITQIEATKAEETIDEAACRAALQHLWNCRRSDKSIAGGPVARQITQQFGVKKVSELKPEQYKPFHAATMAMALEVQKS